MHNHGQGNGCFSGNDPRTITDGKTDPSAFWRVVDGTTDAISARGNDPLSRIAPILSSRLASSLYMLSLYPLFNIVN
jgi:hypothetical protein